MSTYTPTHTPIQTSVDSMGFVYSMFRLPGEDLVTYRRRLYTESHDRSGPTEEDLLRTLSRKLGLFDYPVMVITPAQVDGVNLAADPCIEVTASRFRAWYDFAGEGLDFEIDLLDQEYGAFIGDVETALLASSYWTLETPQENLWGNEGQPGQEWREQPSRLLRIGSSYKVQLQEPLYPSSSNRLDHELISQYRFSASEIFVTEQATYDAVVAAGDFYVDPTNGVVFSYLTGNGSITYQYQDFPFTLWWEPVRVWSLVGQDVRPILYQNRMSESGTMEPLVLSSVGAEIVNQVLASSPGQWGR